MENREWAAWAVAEALEAGSSKLPVDLDEATYDFSAHACYADHAGLGCGGRAIGRRADAV